MRKLNEMFHIEGEQLIKTSNNTIVPEDEPVFILRACDVLAVPILQAYFESMYAYGCTEYFLKGVLTVIEQFEGFRDAHRERMKVPGVVMGK